MSRRVYPLLIAGLILLLAALSDVDPEPALDPCRAADDAPPRRYVWATEFDGPGLANAHRVSRDLLRGAQPGRLGMRTLHGMGVTTIINLRAVHSDRDEIGKLPLKYHHISVKAWHAEDEDVIDFLRIVGDRKNLPAFVHCQFGADRTGMMCAAYRIVIQGWPKEEAISEMVDGGFDYHPIWKGLLEYLREMDVERIRKEAGL
jgi:protein tyrosine/serine phosphatase